MLVSEVGCLSHDIGSFARSLAVLDLTAALATLAVDMNYARPAVNEGREIDIDGGRHPAVEQALQKSGVEFVPNDCL